MHNIYAKKFPPQTKKKGVTETFWYIAKFCLVSESSLADLTKQTKFTLKVSLIFDVTHRSLFQTCQKTPPRYLEAVSKHAQLHKARHRKPPCRRLCNFATLTSSKAKMTHFKVHPGCTDKTLSQPYNFPRYPN